MYGLVLRSTTLSSQQHVSSLPSSSPASGPLLVNPHQLLLMSQQPCNPRTFSLTCLVIMPFIPPTFLSGMLQLARQLLVLPLHPSRIRLCSPFSLINPCQLSQSRPTFMKLCSTLAGLRSRLNWMLWWTIIPGLWYLSLVADTPSIASGFLK